jgi:Predicted pPIWI-associating nuclease
MAHALQAFIQEIDNARKGLNKAKGQQLHSQKQRDGLRLLVERYFNEVRPSVASEQEQGDAIRRVDSDMQDLLALCHKHGSAKSYQQLLANAKSGLISIDAQVVSSAALVTNQQKFESVDLQIVATLQALVPSASLSYQQAVVDLQGVSRLSWRGPATDLREALRETLDHLAPDEDVIAMTGYKQEPNTNGPTMKQKVRFVLKNRGASKAVSAPAESAIEGVEESLGTFVRSVYTRSSVSTHTPTDKVEVLRVRDFVRVVLVELLEIHSA